MKEQFIKYLEEFLLFLTNVKKYSPLTVKTYQTPIKEAIMVSEIYQEDGKSIFDLSKYRFKIASQSKKTINKKLSSIRSFIEFLESKKIFIKLISSNSVKCEQTLPKPIENDKIFNVLQTAPLETKLIVAMIYSLGLRISELASIKLDHIGGEFITVLGKGNKQREIPLNDTLLELIKYYKKEEEPSVYLFEKEGRALTARQLQYRLENSFNSIGIKVTPHQLRHSFATDLLNNGARINDISLLLGHSSLKATGIYTKLNTNTKLKQYNNAHPLLQE